MRYLLALADIWSPGADPPCTMGPGATPAPVPAAPVAAPTAPAAAPVVEAPAPAALAHSIF